MILNAKHSDKSRYSGKVLLTAIMLVFIFVVLAVFMGYGVRVVAVNKCDQANAQLAALNSPQTPKDKPRIGVVKAVVHNSSSSSALVDETIVHVGDTIHGVTIVAIQNNTVEFSKAGVTWKQAMLEAPHSAWTNPAKDNSHPAK